MTLEVELCANLIFYVLKLQLVLWTLQLMSQVMSQVLGNLEGMKIRFKEWRLYDSLIIFSRLKRAPDSNSYDF